MYQMKVQQLVEKAVNHVDPPSRTLTTTVVSTQHPAHRPVAGRSGGRDVLSNDITETAATSRRAHSRILADDHGTVEQYRLTAKQPLKPVPTPFATSGAA